MYIERETSKTKHREKGKVYTERETSETEHREKWKMYTERETVPSLRHFSIPFMYVA